MVFLEHEYMKNEKSFIKRGFADSHMSITL